MKKRRLDPVTAYATDVVDGRVPASRMVRQACQRHLDDLDSQRIKKLEWRPDEAQRVIDFFAAVPTGRLNDSRSTAPFYSVLHLDALDALACALASDGSVLAAGRRWAAEDEYLVRRRVHADLKAALSR